MKTPTSEQPPTSPAGPEGLLSQIGRYRILVPLGAGGMGTVYKAHDPHLDRVVAIKLPHFDGPPAVRDRRMQRFQREARTAARLWHPHVCPIYDIGEHDGQPFVVLAYVEGQSLAQRLASRGRYEDARDAVAIVCQVLDALEAVHAQGIVHRDLTDGNILLDGGGRAVLTDFGLARPEDDAEHLTSEGVILGTPGFIAPEVAAGKPGEVGPWTDLYSLGIVLYRMLTGQLPFEGPPLAVLAKIAGEPPAPPSRWRPDLDPALESILLTALAKEPARRYRKAREFAEALHQWEAGAMPAAHSAPPLRPDRMAETMTETLLANSPVRRPGRQPWWATAPFVGLLAGALTLLVCLWALNGAARDGQRYGQTKEKAGQSTARDPDADAALGAEAAKGHLVRVNELLDRGADPNAKDRQGQTALMRAAGGGHAEVVERLLALAKVEANEIDARGETALMKAAANGHVGVVQCLLSWAGRVAVDLRDDQGQTALGRAKANNHRKVVECLKKLGGRE